MEKASTRNLKSDHIFACILHSKNHLSCKYIDFRSHWVIPLFYCHYCSVTTAVRSVKFPCICFFSHSSHCQPRTATTPAELGSGMRRAKPAVFLPGGGSPDSRSAARHSQAGPCPRDAQGLGTTSWCAGEQPQLFSLHRFYP